jgi:hypothetical protein
MTSIASENARALNAFLSEAGFEFSSFSSVVYRHEF